MKKKIAILLALISTESIATMRIRLDTYGNTVGIQEGTETYYISGSRLAKPSITTSDGRVFAHFSREEGSATGTPPHLMYNNYIGSYRVAKSRRDKTRTMPGSARRVVFCAGKRGCKTKRCQ